MKRLFSAVLMCTLCVCLALAQTGEKKSSKKSEGKKSAAGDVKGGEAAFKEKCAICHYPDKAERRIGPGLKGVFKHEKLFDGRKVSEANIREMILKGGGKMVGFEDQLEPKQVDALIAYLKTL